MNTCQNSQILHQLRQLRSIESHLESRFETLHTAEPQLRGLFLDSLEEWRIRGQMLDHLLENPPA